MEGKDTHCKQIRAVTRQIEQNITNYLNNLIKILTVIGWNI